MGRGLGSNAAPMGRGRSLVRGEGNWSVLTTTSVRGAARGARFRLALLSVRFLSGLGLAAFLPEGVGEARKNARQSDERNRNTNDKQDDDKTTFQDGDVKSEKRNDDSDKGEDRKDRNDRSGSNDGDEKVRQESKRQDTSSQSSDEDQDGDAGGGRRNGDGDAESAQRARNNNNDSGDNLDDEPSPTPTPVPPPATNPNVTIPDTSGTDPDDVELIVQSNPDVIAQTSASGGFAFAQSGGVTAISGPDGAKIIQTGEAGAGTVTPAPTPTPSQPSPDGGDNNTGFTS